MKPQSGEIRTHDMGRKTEKEAYEKIKRALTNTPALGLLV
jgi:hypothetical protein